MEALDPDCLYSVASGSWDPDQAPAHVSQRHEAPKYTQPLVEHRALSRGQGVRSKRQIASLCLLEANSPPRDGDRNLDHLSPDPGLEVGSNRQDGDSQAPPSPPYPQPALMRS